MDGDGDGVGEEVLVMLDEIPRESEAEGDSDRLEVLEGEGVRDGVRVREGV